MKCFVEVEHVSGFGSYVKMGRFWRVRLGVRKGLWFRGRVLGERERWKQVGGLALVLQRDRVSGLGLGF